MDDLLGRIREKMKVLVKGMDEDLWWKAWMTQGKLRKSKVKIRKNENLRKIRGLHWVE